MRTVTRTATERKGGDRSQQQAAGREGGRTRDDEDKRKAGQEGGTSSGLARGLEVLLRVDAKVKTTLPPSLRRPTSGAVKVPTNASRTRTA
jgi:hypothetical protein